VHESATHGYQDQQSDQEAYEQEWVFKKPNEKCRTNSHQLNYTTTA